MVLGFEPELKLWEVVLRTGMGLLVNTENLSNFGTKRCLAPCLVPCHWVGLAY